MLNQQSQFKLPKRVVLLGASGFLGRALAQYLKDKTEVVALSSKDVDLFQESSVDALKSRVASGDALVFLSAITPDKGKDSGTLIKNMLMAQNVAGFVEQSQLSQCIYISSDAVYADDINPVREASYCAPSTLYGCMHVARELTLKAAVQKPKIPYAVLRPSAVYGALDTHNSYGPNRFLRMALKDSKITLFGNGEEMRDHVYIDDVVRVIALCLGHRFEGVLNLATGVSSSFMDVAQAVAKQVGSQVKIEPQPRSGPITHRHFDTTAAIRAFPSFQYTPLNVGISQSVEQLKKNL